MFFSLINFLSLYFKCYTQVCEGTPARKLIASSNIFILFSLQNLTNRLLPFGLFITLGAGGRGGGVGGGRGGVGAGGEAGGGGDPPCSAPVRSWSYTL